MTARRRGIYEHPTLGALDVFADVTNTWMYALPGEVGDVPDAWWEVLTWRGERVYPAPAGLNDSIGTFYFLQRGGAWEGYFCDRCGAGMARGILPDDQWPDEHCHWCGGTLTKRFFRREESLEDDGPDEAPSPYRAGPGFFTPLTWAAARERLAAFRRRVAARQPGQVGWTYRAVSPDG